jgi:exopolyphosphatase/guanosine-5'-triphosphate,3'-diphosphate pyrophosphatase
MAESDEIYLLSLATDASVKARGGLLDVKRLERVSEDGLELWRPVMKARFPLSADDVGSVMAALGAAVPPPARGEYSLDGFLDEVVRPSSTLRAVEVHKHRRHYTVGGCMVELSEVGTDRGSAQTVAVESERPERVLAVVRDLGLELRRNVSVPRALKAIVGFGARYAVVDVGTNSVKFHVGERTAEGGWTTVADRAEVTRLGEGLDAVGRLGARQMERTLDAIAGMVDQAHRDGVAATAAVGTAGLRIAANSAEFVAAVRESAGIEIEVISGEEESRLAYLAATSGLGVRLGSLVVFDTGGGSSQFTFGHDRQVEERFSVNVGAVRLTERYDLGGAVSEEVLASALEAISADLARLDGRPAPDTLIGLGGAVTNLAAVMHRLETYDPDVVQGAVIDAAEIDRQIELYRTRTAEERRAIVGLQPNRAEVILAGACVVRTVLSKLGRESLTVSDRGLRHGLLVDRFGR